MSAITDEKYVSFTTFRRNGKRVSTPVWIADLGDGTVGFTTPGDSGKVKRLRADTQVELQPCDLRGNVADGATTHVGSGSVVVGADSDRVHAAIKDKYGLQVTLIDLVNKVTRRTADRVGIIITLDGTA